MCTWCNNKSVTAEVISVFNHNKNIVYIAINYIYIYVLICFCSSLCFQSYWLDFNWITWSWRIYQNGCWNIDHVLIIVRNTSKIWTANKTERSTLINLHVIIMCLGNPRYIYLNIYIFISCFLNCETCAQVYKKW